jgi:hypothetical protein
MKKPAVVLTLLSAAGTALAQPSQTQSPPEPQPEAQPQPAGPQTTLSTLDASAAPTVEQPKKDGPKEPKSGDFNAGGQARFPSGPDEMGQFASFNWVAVDLKGRYYLLKTVTLDANVPLAIIKPDTVGPMGPEPSVFGGFTLSLDARMQAPKMPGVKYETIVGVNLTAGYMKEGAMLLSDKDYPLFIGSMKPGFAGGLVTKVKLSSLLDFSLIPTWVYQSGSMESLTAIQIPMALQIGLGNVAKLNVELGVYTGDDYSFSGDNGGRLATGASLDLKLGPMLLHAGAGVASLLTGGVYPTISDSFYVDLNAKYAK